MPQFNFGNLESPLSGEELINDNLEPWRDALHSTHSGSTRPDYVTDGMIWLDTTGNPWILNLFKGAVDIPLFEIDTDTDEAAASGIAASDFIKTLLDDANAATARATLGLVIGADVQAYNTILNLLAGLTAAANKGVYFTGGSSMATFDLTAAGRALLDDADAAAQRTTLGLGTAAVLDAGTSANNAVQLDGSARLPAVDGSQLTNLPLETVVFDGTLSNASSENFTWTAGQFSRVRIELTNYAQSGSSGVVTTGLLRMIDNGTLRSSNNQYQNNLFDHIDTRTYKDGSNSNQTLEGIGDKDYERTNAMTFTGSNAVPYSNGTMCCSVIELFCLKGNPIMHAITTNPQFGSTMSTFKNTCLLSSALWSGVQILLSSGSRAHSTSTKCKIVGYT